MYRMLLSESLLVVRRDIYMVLPRQDLLVSCKNGIESTCQTRTGEHGVRGLSLDWEGTWFPDPKGNRDKMSSIPQTLS